MRRGRAAFSDHRATGFCRLRKLGLECLETRSLLTASALITEIMVNNGDGLVDAEGDHSDWIEIFNPNTEPLNLSDWYLTDDPSDPRQWKFPGSANISPNSPFVVFASGKDKIDLGGNFHTNFNLDESGGFLALVKAQGTTILDSFILQYPAQHDSISYGVELIQSPIGSVDPSWQQRFFQSPTPGIFNQDGKIDFLNPIQPNVTRGFFDESFELTFTSPDNLAEIYYTTDGTAPNDGRNGLPENGTPYTQVITIDRTTTLRAAAFAEDYFSSIIDTQTYWFIDDIQQQSSDPSSASEGYEFPTTWGGGSLGAEEITANYEVDQRIISQSTEQEIQDAFKSLPSVSLVMPTENFFDPEIGIYNSIGSLSALREHEVSVEFYDPATAQQFQVDAGIKLQGNGSTLGWNSQKMSLRLLFKKEYGPSRLKYPLFEDSTVEEFNTLVLDAAYALSWTYNANADPDFNNQRHEYAQYLRDQFAMQLQLSQGGLAPRGRFIHLYLNGLYWGVYNLHERPDADFHHQHVGGDEDDWDVIRHRRNNVQDGSNIGWLQLMSVVNLTLEDGQTPYVSTPQGYAHVQSLVDVEDLADNMIRHFYVGSNVDWPSSNWYAARNRKDSNSKWTFPSWDVEHSLKNVDDNEVLNVNNVDGSPVRIYSQLVSNPDFRMLFADRLQKHFFNDGAMSVDPDYPEWDPENPQNNRPAALYASLAEQIEQAMVLESARWGDTLHPDDPMDIDDWTAQRDRLFNEYFPQRTAIVLQQFTEANLFPTLAAPQILVNNQIQHGGLVSADDYLSFADLSVAIFYTTDGSDPRMPGGDISHTIQPWVGDFQLTTTTTIKVRNLDDGQWSALTELKFIVDTVAADSTNLRITELNYHPADPFAAELAIDNNLTNKSFEFIEFQNISQQTIDLSQVRLVDGVHFNFSDSDTEFLEPGQYTLAVRDLDAFSIRYPNVSPANIAGEYRSGLKNSGERILLIDAMGDTIADFSYSDSTPWSDRAAGLGSSLVVGNLLGNYSDPENWFSSQQYHGTPSTDDLQTPPNVLINEVVLSQAGVNAGMIELYNTSIETVDLSGWWMTDSLDQAAKFIIPNNTIIAPGDLMVLTLPLVNETSQTPTSSATDVPTNTLLLDRFQEGPLWLIESDSAGRSVRFADQVNLLQTDQPASYGRWDSSRSDLYPFSTSSLGDLSYSTYRSGVVISELMFDPPDDLNPTGNVENLRYLELFNATPTTVDLSAWMLRGASDFIFPNNITLPSAETLLVVNFDITDDQLLSEFLAAYQLPNETQVIGSFTIQLDNPGDQITLFRPRTVPVPLPFENLYYLKDQVSYLAADLWPSNEIGSGQSLHRLQENFFGNDSASWTAAPASPDDSILSAYDLGDINYDHQVDQADLLEILRNYGRNVYSLAVDLSGDGKVGLHDLLLFKRAISAPPSSAPQPQSPANALVVHIAAPIQQQIAAVEKNNTNLSISSPTSIFVTPILSPPENLQPIKRLKAHRIVASSTEASATDQYFSRREDHGQQNNGQPQRLRARLLRAQRTSRNSSQQIIDEITGNYEEKL